MKPILELNQSNFDREVLESNLPVVVDFWAEWCGPCRMLAPVLEEIARETEGRAVVAKVNVDEHPGLAGRFHIQGLPTLLYFNRGELRDLIVGVASKKTITTKLAGLHAAAASAVHN